MNNQPTGYAELLPMSDKQQASL